MLQNWISQNMFLYGMAAAGVLGLLCTLAANHFYNRVIGDLKRPDQPKTKWMGQTLSLYREKSRGKMLPNPDVFVRNQLNEGRVLGISLSRWRRGVGYLGLVCFAGTCAAVYGCYQYHLPEIVRYQHAVLGMGIFLGKGRCGTGCWIIWKTVSVLCSLSRNRHRRKRKKRVF